MAITIKRPPTCLVHRIWPKYEQCPWREQVEVVTCTTTKVGTKDLSGEHVCE